MKAPLPPDEAGRLKALQSYEILDTAPEQAFDDITLLASQICETPIAMISLVGEDRQWFKSRIGTETSETARDIAFCAHGILQAEVLVVADARADERFADSPLVSGGPRIRFYAGAPLVTPDGHRLGMLCVNDRVPRQLSAGQLAALQALSRQVVSQLELRRGLAELRGTVAQLGRSEASLRASEEKFHQLADTITDVFWIVSPDFKTIHYVSKGYEAIWGRSTQSLYDRPHQWFETILPEDREQAMVAFGLLGGADAKMSIEYRVTRPDGSVRWIHDRGFQVRDSTGVLIRITGVATDTTERKQAESETQQLADRLTTTLESLTDGFFTLDRDWRFTYVNREAERMLGQLRSDLLGRHIWDRFPEARGTISQREYERAVRDGVVVQFDTFYPPLGIWFDARAFPSAQGLAVYFRDVTAVRRAEEALRESEERFSGAFEHAPIGVALAAPDGRWLQANRALCDLVGYSEADLLSRTFADITHPDDLEASNEQMHRLLAGEINSCQLEKRYIHADGHLVTVLVSISLVRDSLRQPRYFIAQIQDITTRKKAEADLAAAHGELVALSRQSGMAEVATGVLHNVGNVLNSVNVSATLVADHVSHSKGVHIAKLAAMFREHQADLPAFLTNDPRGQMIPAYLETLTESLAQERKTVVAELDHLKKNVGHIKDIVAMQQSYARKSGILEPVAMADLIDDALRMNASSLARHDIELVRDFQVNPTISTDKHKIVQILINLVRNAQLACDEGGRSDKRIIVQLAADAHRIRISVSDNGIGIPAENLARIFGHGFTTRKEGHGFGLHSGALAARELGGSLAVQSDGPGHGATFLLELPRKLDTASP